MADNNTNGTEKGPGANGDAAVSESQPIVPPASKGPLNTGEDSVEPLIATETATETAATAPTSESSTQNNATTTSSKEGELAEKIDKAEKPASQPEKPADPVPTRPIPTDTTTAEAPSLTNGETKEPPKPVAVEEIRDQDIPDTAPTQTAEMTGALPVQEPTKDVPEADPKPVASKPEKIEASIGDKRKLSEAEEAHGDTTIEKSSEDVPVEKKQKTNGSATNGAPKKAGRPRKNKKAAPVVGRAARKTRSQGTAD
ncbi:hypothetical protein F4804DRAFT_347133 [Jackrogersella minutella]|nr:hypothetical protein F4804DRAFT_347133 [Jackrogersella minutella]